MTYITVTTESEGETKKIAEEFVKDLKPGKNGAVVIALRGELGAGKTSFVQGLARGLGIGRRVTSPTFVISKGYAVRSMRTPFRSLFHLDFYRLSDEEDLAYVDFEEMITKPTALVAIEWAERILKAIPPSAIWITFERIKEKERKIIIKTTDNRQLTTDNFCCRLSAVCCHRLIKKKTFLVIDAHALIHRAYHALPPLTSPGGEVVGAVYGFTSVLIKVLRELRPDYAAAAFDLPGPTIRHREFKEYKATRPKAPDDLKHQFRKVREVVSAFGIPVLEKPEYEADDIIGTLVKGRLAREKREGGLNIIILSGDLDTLQLVDRETKVYTFRKGFSDTVVYDENGVRERFGVSPRQFADFKGLMGDPSDNIPGVPGVGAKTSRDLIQTFGSIETLYKKLGASSVSPRLKEKLFEWKDQAFSSKQLATIHTDVRFPFELSRAHWETNYHEPAVTDLFRRFGFFSLLKRLTDVTRSRPPKPKERINQSEGRVLQRREAEALLPRDGELVLDFMFEEGGGKVSFVQDGKSLAFDLMSPEARKFLLNPQTRKIVYDFKHILRELWKRGIDIRGVEKDVMLMGYLISPGERDYSVERLAFLYAGAEGRQTSRVGYLSALAHILRGKIKEAGLDAVFYDIEMPLAPILAKMERAGISISVSRLQKLSAVLSREIELTRKKIVTLAGREFNINSPKDLRAVLFEELHVPVRGLKKTPTGLVSTSAEYLEHITSLHPIIPLVLKHRELFKLKSTYVDALPKLAGAKSNRIHTTFNQAGTATGRLSSSYPNLQNIPKRGDWARRIRGSFVAPSGRVFVSFDYSQIELRIIAHLSRDKKMGEAFARDEDIHAFTAGLIYHIDQKNITRQMRETAKALNFGMIYGISAARIARSLNINLEEARLFLKGYFREFSGVAHYIEKVKGQARERGYAETLLGRRRYLPEIHSSHHELRAQAERAAVNMTAQGANADFIKMAMINVDRYLEETRLDAQLLLQIHDDLLFEMRRDIVERAVPEITRIMETVYTLVVPLKVEAMIGRSWGNMVPYNQKVKGKR